MNQIIEKLNKILEKKSLLAFSYWLLLLIQYVIIESITWKFESIFFISLTFSLLLLFMIFSFTLVSILIAIVTLWYIAFNSISEILTYTCIFGIIFLIILFIYLYLSKYHKQHKDKLHKATKIWEKVYIWMTIWISIMLLIISILALWKELIWNPKEVIIERNIWEYEEYKFRFYNLDYYFLETNSWAIKIFDNSSIKSIQFK